MISLFHEVCDECSKQVTKKYSTSFSSAVRLLHKDLRGPIYNIYGFVRFADEIVDSFHEHDKKYLLEKFEADTYEAIDAGISLNPIIHGFQQTVNRYRIPGSLIASFLHSMKLDLYKTEYSSDTELDEYIYGSAEAVGLMCLCVFCDGNISEYNKLVEPARRLGAAFQKINFLRDMQADYQELSRVYFPGIDIAGFDDDAKLRIEADLEQDFREGLAGIRQLPWKARLGVFTAYRYYRQLFRKIKSMRPKAIMEQRVRVPNIQKLAIIMQAGICSRLNRI
jgi:phytoene synthase